VLKRSGMGTTSAVARPDGTLHTYQPYGQAGVLLADLDLSAATGLLAARYRALSTSDARFLIQGVRVLEREIGAAAAFGHPQARSAPRRCGLRSGSCASSFDGEQLCFRRVPFGSRAGGSASFSSPNETRRAETSRATSSARPSFGGKRTRAFVGFVGPGGGLGRSLLCEMSVFQVCSS